MEEENEKTIQDTGVEVTDIDTKKKQLEVEKLELEIQNLQDLGLSNFERTIKKRVVPVFLPFLTLLATSLFFYITWKSGEKSKAIDRYKSEVDMINMVWDDIKSDTSSVASHTSKDFLVAVFNANVHYYKNDNDYLGIEMNQRPIKIITNMNIRTRKEVQKIETNAKVADAIGDWADNGKANTKVPDKMSSTQTILKYKEPEVVNTANMVASTQMKTYLQYRNNQYAEMAQHLANELKPFYIVPPIDLIDNITYGNEIRYYNDADLPKAQQLALHIKKITGQDFLLKNIKNNKIKNVMEIWYNNLPPVSAPVVFVPVARQITPTIAKQPEIIATKDCITTPRAQTWVDNIVLVKVDSYNDETHDVIMRINDIPAIIKVGETKTVTSGVYDITVTVQSYKRAKIRMAVFYRVLVTKKQQ